MNYELIELPKSDTESLKSEFMRLVIDKEILYALGSIKSARAYKLYAVIDGALDQEIDQYIEIYQPSYRKLYPEAYSKAAGYAQPFLVDLESSAAFMKWFLEHGYGENRAVYLLSVLDMDTIAYNIASFTVGHIEDGMKETFFRFYDPKIFPAFLQILRVHQMKKLFNEQRIWLCENFLEPNRIDIYMYNQIGDTVLRVGHDLYFASTPLCNINAVIHPGYKHSDQNSEEEDLVFGLQEIQLITQYKEALFTKQVCLSLMQQVEHFSHINHFQEIFHPIAKIIRKGIEVFGLTDPEANYLWVVAHTFHKDIDILLQKDATHKDIFSSDSQASQSYKAEILEEIIERFQELLQNKEVING